MVHPYLVMRYRLDGVIAVVDAVNGAATLEAHPEAVKQAAVADRIVLTKTDLVGDAHAGALRTLMQRLRALNPAAPILDAAAGEAVAARLFDCGLYDPATKTADVRRWLAAEAYGDAQGAAQGLSHNDRGHGHDPNRHDAHIRAFCLSTDAAIPASAFEMFLDLVRSMHGPKLLRMKGVVKIAETPQTPMVVHAVQHLMHPLARLPGWPDGDERTRIVFIVRDIDPRTISELFDAFLGAAAPDRADRAAIADNPLVPFGGVDR
jgi:G3E family GTPase